jgi:hypothetical protein
MRPERATESATAGATDPVSDDPDLAAVIAAWPRLSSPVRKRITKLAAGVPLAEVVPDDL